jgi:hypothetical protein
VPKVAVITPVLNAAAYLPQAIASVQAQTWPDWELLIVDDGSIDGSLDLAEEAASRDSRIRVLRTSGRTGAAAARNLGLAAAKAEFVAFLDADDLFEPGKLAIDLACFDANPQAMMVYGPTLWWWEEDASRTSVERMGRYADRLHAAPTLFQDILIDQKGVVPCTCAVLIRTAALQVVGGFDESFALYEDQTIWVKIMLRYPVAVHGVVTSRYRQHSGSTSAQATRDGRYTVGPHEARLPFLEWSAREAAAAGAMTPKVRRALRLALAAYGRPPEPLSAMDRLAIVRRRAGARVLSAPKRALRLAKRLCR